MLIINGFEVPKGLTDKPMYGTTIFVEFDNDKDLYKAYPWFNEVQDNSWLQCGIVHSNKESAVKSCKARLGIDPYKMIVIKKIKHHNTRPPSRGFFAFQVSFDCRLGYGLGIAAGYFRSKQKEHWMCFGVR